MAGYSCAFLADGLWGCSGGAQLYALPREMITRDTSLADFARRAGDRADLPRLIASLRAGNFSPRNRSQSKPAAVDAAGGQDKA